MGDITLEVCGQQLKIRETPVKGKDHTYHVLRRADSTGGREARYGTPVIALAKTLPTSVKVDGVEVQLKHSTTDDGRAKVSAHQAVDTTIGRRAFTFSVSETKTGGWNIVAKLNRTSGGFSASPESLADNLAGLL
jgi:hypothetical protein